jgi:Family of unknown function (DUF5317)
MRGPGVSDRRPPSPGATTPHCRLDAHSGTLRPIESTTRFIKMVRARPVDAVRIGVGQQTKGVFVLLVLALLTGLLVARARGGTLDALGRIRVRLGWFVLVAVGALIVAAVAPRLQTIGWLVAAVSIAVLAGANRRIPGLFLLFVGLALNTVAIAANHGKMPVSTAAISSAGLHEAKFARSDHYVLADHDTHLRPLGDVIAFPFWGVPAALSAGDVLIAAGIGLFAGLAPVRASRSLRARHTARASRRRSGADPATDDGGDLPDPVEPLDAAPARRRPVTAVPPRPAADRRPSGRRGTMAPYAGDEPHGDDETERRSRYGEEEA